MTGKKDRPLSTSSTGSLMQDVPGAFPTTSLQNNADDQTPVSLSQAVHARRAEYVRQKQLRIKVGTWNVAGRKGTERDIAAWFVQGKGVAAALSGLTVEDQEELHRKEVPERSGAAETEDVNSQEARYSKNKPTVPEGDTGTLPGDDKVGLYVLGLQEMVDISSMTEAIRPYTDPTVATNWKKSISEGLPAGYRLVAEQQLIGLYLLIYASPDVAPEVRSVSTTSVGTGLGGFMGNKGAVTARLVLGETTRLVFVNCHLAAGADKSALDRRNWDAGQIISRTRFEPIQDSMDLQQTTGEEIGDEDFAFWMGDLNYRLEGIPGDDVRRLLMLHTRNEYDLSQRSQKIEKELQRATDVVKSRQQDEASSIRSSMSTSPRTSTDARASIDTSITSLADDIAASDDPTSLQTTLSSLLPHDELHQQMNNRKAFHDGWKEGPITFLPTYKYDVGSVGVFDSSEKKRAPSWCDRIIYRTRRDRLAYLAKVKEEENSRKKDEEMKASGTDLAANDESILYDYDPEADGDDDYDEYDEYNDADDGVVITKEGYHDEIELEYYTAHQRVLSSDHKPLDAIFKLTYGSVVPELKTRVHAEVAKEMDKVENENRPTITVVVDKHRDEDVEVSDDDPANFEGVWFGSVRWGQAKHRSITLANTGRAAATFSFIERPVASHQIPGIAPSWINLRQDEQSIASTVKSTPSVTLEPGDTSIAELELRIFDMTIARELNEGLRSLDDILLIRVDGGRDHFVPVRARWSNTSLGHSIDRLVRIPEGGIRRLQSQKLKDKGKVKGTPSSGRSGSHATEEPASPVDDQPVRFSAPRELFRLTEAVEDLTARVVAEWDMINPAFPDSAEGTQSDPTPPWVEYPGWPFDDAAWSEKDSSQFQDGLSAAVDALDSDQSLEGSLAPEVPRMQKLYTLASVLLLFLRSMPDGVVTPQLWSQVESFRAENEKQKRKLSSDEEKMATQEILSQSPSHSISFVLVTSMMERLLQDIYGNADSTSRFSLDGGDSPVSPTRRAAGTLRRMATLGKLPTDSSLSTREVARQAMVRIFSEVLVKTASVGGDKSRSVLEKRKTEMVRMFVG